MKNVIIGAAAIVAAMTGLTGQSVAQTTELRFNWWVPGMHLQRTKIAEPWIKAVEEATQGRVKISLTATSLGPPPRQFDLVRDGIADIAFASHGYNPDRFVLPAGVELPFISDSAEATSVALWRAHEKFFAAKNEFAGVKLLGVYAHGPGGLWSREQPIQNMESFKGLKIRSGGGAQDDIIKALGGVAITSPAPTTYEVLSRGVVDATLFDQNSIVAFKLDKLVKSYLEVPGGLYTASFYYIMNEDKFAKLSKADQDAIMKVSGEHLAKLAGKAWDEDDRAVAKQFGTIGVNHLKASGAFLASMKAALKPIEDKYIADVKEKRGLDGQEILNFIRQTTASYKP